MPSDFVVVGAGSAGCVVAARLAESSKHRVLLLEAGGKDSNPMIHIPIGFHRLLSNPRLMWLQHGAPEPGLNDRRLMHLRGKVLGGSSSINAMIYMRGAKEDFDDWRALGNVGWGYSDVLPYFKKAENQSRGADAYHGIAGPVWVTDPDRLELYEAYLAATEELGLPRNLDFNGATQEGSGYYQLTTRRGRRRNSTAVGYLRDARRRPNLEVVTNALVIRVLFEGKRATGVEYRIGDQTKTAHATRAVILSAGAFNTPQILQLSGIGAPEHLQSLGIPVIHALPGVGAGLRDHFATAARFVCAKPVTLNDRVASFWGRAQIGAEYLLHGRGPISRGSVSAGGFYRSSPTAPRPDLQVHVTPFSMAAARKLDTYSGFGIGIQLSYPDSRGWVRLRTPVPTDDPEIRMNYLSEESDQQRIVAAVRLVRRITQTRALSPYVKEERLPGPGVSTDDEILRFVRENGSNCFHVTSSCRMGIDADAVVDPRLRVHGLSGLRIADASVMPTLISGNTNASVIMIGEKAANMILDDV